MGNQTPRSLWLHPDGLFLLLEFARVLRERWCIPNLKIDANS